MNLWHSLAKHKAVPIAAALLVLMIAGWSIVVRSTASSISGVYFYDLNAGTLYVVPQDTVPPHTAPSGGEGVQAYVYDCGQCQAGTRQIGYFIQYTPELKSLMERGEEAAPEAMLHGKLIRTPEGNAWVAAGSPLGRRIVEELKQRCSQPKPLVVCQP